MKIRRKKIMMVDDDPQFLSCECDSLSEVGYEVIPVEEPSRVISVAIRERPDLILLDLTFPLTEGYDVARALAEHPELSKVPVIFLSGRDRWMDAEYARRFGAFDYVAKPVSRATLLGKIRKALSARSYRRRSQENYSPCPDTEG